MKELNSKNNVQQAYVLPTVLLVILVLSLFSASLFNIPFLGVKERFQQNRQAFYMATDAIELELFAMGRPKTAEELQAQKEEKDHQDDLMEAEGDDLDSDSTQMESSQNLTYSYYNPDFEKVKVLFDTSFFWGKVQSHAEFKNKKLSLEALVGGRFNKTLFKAALNLPDSVRLEDPHRIDTEMTSSAVASTMMDKVTQLLTAKSELLMAQLDSTLMGDDEGEYNDFGGDEFWDASEWKSAIKSAKSKGNKSFIKRELVIEGDLKLNSFRGLNRSSLQNQGVLVKVGGDLEVDGEWDLTQVSFLVKGAIRIDGSLRGKSIRLFSGEELVLAGEGRAELEVLSTKGIRIEDSFQVLSGSVLATLGKKEDVNLETGDEDAVLSIESSEEQRGWFLLSSNAERGFFISSSSVVNGWGILAGDGRLEGLWKGSLITQKTKCDTRVKDACLGFGSIERRTVTEAQEQPFALNLGEAWEPTLHGLREVGDL